MDYVGTLKELISIDTCVSPELDPSRNYRQTIDYLEPMLRQVGFETLQVEIPPEYAEGRPGRVNLVGHRRATGKPRLIFYTHIDTVPAHGWDAFTPKVEAGKIYGRGAADMKGAIAALLFGLDMAKHRSLKYDTSVIVTTDEEMSQATQIRYLAQFLQPLEGAYFFSLDASFGYVGIAALGVLQADIRVKGQSVHSGLSHLGENAIEKAHPILTALLQLKEKVTQRESGIPVNPKSGLTHMVPRLNVNVIRGGLKVNVVPDECVISVDRRLIPEENVEEAEAELMDALRAVPGVRWKLDNVGRIPTVPPVGDPIVDKLAAIIQEVTGETGKYGEMGSGDFGPVVRLEWGAKLFSLGVIRAECNIHGMNEFAYQKDIEDLAVIIARFVSAE